MMLLLNTQFSKFFLFPSSFSLYFQSSLGLWGKSRCMVPFSSFIFFLWKMLGAPCLHEPCLTALGSCIYIFFSLLALLKASKDFPFLNTSLQVLLLSLLVLFQGPFANSKFLNIFVKIKEFYWSIVGPCFHTFFCATYTSTKLLEFITQWHMP